MEYNILKQGNNAILEVKLNANESLKSESGAMVTKTPNINVDGKMEGGLLSGLGRKLLTGETFFMQHLKCESGVGKTRLAPTYYGEIKELDISENNTFLIQKDGFLASEETVNVNTKMQNLSKGLFSGEGFFIMEVKGEGKLFISSRGAIQEIILENNEEIIIDNQHLVAWNSEMEYNIEKASKSILNSVKSGEYLVTRFKGPGKIYIQTRNKSAILKDIPVK